ncbi:MULTISPECIES: hypothetical protein [Methylobacteriaceae]|uniref:hypothetical protein n=1 Tax=Methylobacteriaceae TaxID=119045 RepID=UPI00074F8C56|nr:MULTISPECIES: hypothetical protein [Methylobacteriaceae]AMB48161.1 hypothetical protein Y590_24650 [Methylobacterium sp. AMS5]TFZ58679.1 hypothetical protein E4V01_10975 [Methylorubrum sp. Q1]
MDGFFAPLFASGRIVDAILVLVALEALLLLAVRARWGRGPAPGPLLSNLASGAALMLALRAALTGAAWPGVAAWMAAALAAHLTEMVIRFRRDGATDSPDCDTLAGNNQKWRTFGARPPMT